MQKYPEPTVGALIFNSEGKIFLMRSHKWRGKYVIPGRHIELGETAEQALKREVKEETGFDIYDVQFVCIQEFIFGKGFWKKRHFLFFDYSCRTNSDKVNLNDEAQGYAWVLVKDALKLPLETYTKKAIKAFLHRF